MAEQQGSFKIRNIMSLVEFAKQFSAEEFKSFVKVKKELEGLFEQFFVQRLVSRYESFIAMGFDQKRATDLTMEYLETTLRKAINDKAANEGETK